MHVPASFHLTDALYGLITGALAVAAAILFAIYRGRRDRTEDASGRVGVVPVALAAVAGLLAMYLARAVRRGIIDDISTRQALVVGVAGVIAGLGWAWMARVLAPVWIAALVLISAVGVWAAVPDTETAVAVLGAWVPFFIWAAFAGRTAPAAAESFGFAYVASWIALAIVLAWAAAWGSDAEPSSLPGALACFGVALVIPWVVATVRRIPKLIWLLPSQVVAVTLASRWATDVSSTGAGIARSTALLAVLIAVVAVSCWPAAREHPLPSDRPEHPR